MEWDISETLTDTSRFEHVLPIADSSSDIGKQAPSWIQNGWLQNRKYITMTIIGNRVFVVGWGRIPRQQLHAPLATIWGQNTRNFATFMSFITSMLYTSGSQSSASLDFVSRSQSAKVDSVTHSSGIVDNMVYSLEFRKYLTCAPKMQSTSGLESAILNSCSRKRLLSHVVGIVTSHH